MTHTPQPTQGDLAAGRALDTLVATKVMGWHLVPSKSFGPRGWATWDDSNGNAQAAGVGGGFKPSTDISAAWQIVEWAEASPRGWKLTLMRSGRSLPDYVWICTFHRGHQQLARVVEQAAPLAICRAALAAVSG